MRNQLRGAVAASAVAAAFIAPAFIAPAVASAADTIVTFTVASGVIAITASPAAPLVTNAGNTAATGVIPVVTVTDARLGTANWTATAASLAFTNIIGGSSGTTIPASDVTYTPNTAVKVGVSTVTAGSTGTLGSAITAQSATGVRGLNTATWIPNVSVALPADATSGLYTGTITHSVA